MEDVRTNDRTGVNPFESQATTIVVLGIVGLVVFPPAGTVAWIMGARLRKAANAAGYPEPGRSPVGRICRVIATLFIVAIVVGPLLFKMKPELRGLV